MKDFEIRCDESRLETNHSLYGKFTLGPFLPGQGTTFGNALRRSLLSELPGLAITAFEILGIMQEFSILPGLRESILDLSLNLKQVVLTGILPYSTPPIGFLKIRGPAVIKATDLKLPAGIYCTSPDQYIATLSSDGILNLKFVVSVGKGYSTQPYSFYRSLSKIKLQSTFYNASRENEEQNALLTNRSEVMNGLRTPPKTKSTESLFHESKEEDTKTGIHSTNQTTSPLFPTNVTPNHALVSVPNGVRGEAELLQKKVVENEVSVFNKAEIRTDAANVFTNQPIANSISSSGLGNKTNSKFIPTLRDPLRDQNSDLFNTSSSSLNTVNGVSRFSSEINQYGDIQSQIFQRIKPHQVLPIDAVFTPVSQVNFLIQINDRFEIPRENIVLEIWTNGSIHPKRALEESILSLVQSFDTLLKKIQQSSSIYKGLRYWSYLQSSNDRNNEISVPLNPSFDNVEKTKDKKMEQMIKDGKTVSGSSKIHLHRAIYNLDIGNLNLSLETFVLLKKANIDTLAQLLTHFSSQKNTLAINSKDIEDSFFLGEKTVNELKKVVAQFS